MTITASKPAPPATPTPAKPRPEAVRAAYLHDEVIRIFGVYRSWSRTSNQPFPQPERKTR